MQLLVVLLTGTSRSHTAIVQQTMFQIFDVYPTTIHGQRLLRADLSVAAFTPTYVNLLVSHATTHRMLASPTLVFGLLALSLSLSRS